MEGRETEGRETNQLEPHPRLVMLRERFGSHATAISLSGFVGPSPAGTVRLFPTPSASECIEVPEAEILHFEQDDVYSPAELFVNPWAIVTAVSTRKALLVTTPLQEYTEPDGEPRAVLRLAQNGVGDEKPKPKTCVEKRIEECKKDPMRDPKWCETKGARNLFDSLCTILGDPKVTGFDFI